MMQHYNYSLTELDNMMPWEREIYVGMLKQHIQEENERIKNDEDPLKIFKKKVTESGLLELSQLEALEEEAKGKIKIAIEESKKAEFPSAKDLLTDVYIKY